MTDIPQISASWLGIALAAGPVFQWVGSWLLDMRRDRRADSATIGGQMETMIRVQQQELARTNDSRAAYWAELEVLREARLRMGDRMAELRDAAIAGRAMVHELERKFGLPETTFPPLPSVTLGGSQPPLAAAVPITRTQGPAPPAA